MAVIVPGQFSLTHTRSTSDSLDLIIRDGVFKNFTLDSRNRLQYNLSRWSQRAVINEKDGSYYSVNPLPTVYADGISTEGCYEYTIDLQNFPLNQEIWIPVDYLPNISDQSILSIYVTDALASEIYDSYDDYHSAGVPIQDDGPGVDNFGGGIILNKSDFGILTRYASTAASPKVDLGYTYLDGRYLIHVLYSSFYQPSENQYNSAKIDINTFDTKYYSKYIGSPVLILDNKIKGYRDSESLIYLYDDSIHYKDEYVSLPKHELFNTDLVEYVSGDVNILTKVPDGFIISMQNYCDERSDLTRYLGMINTILDEEYYLRCIIIDETLSSGIISAIQSRIRSADLDNAPNISLVVMSTSSIKSDGSMIMLGDEIYDSGGSLFIESVDAFYKVIESMDSDVTFSYVTVVQERPGVHLKSSLSDTAGLPQIEDYHYSAEELDPFLLQLYINTFHACINKCREEIISDADKERAIKNALMTYGAPDAYDYEVSTTDEMITITCSVDYKKKTETININLNLIING